MTDITDPEIPGPIPMTESMVERTIASALFWQFRSARHREPEDLPSDVLARFEATKAPGVSIHEYYSLRADQIIAALASKGFVIVPVEPSGAILNAIEKASLFRDIKPGVRECIGYESPEKIYRAAISTAAEEGK